MAAMLAPLHADFHRSAERANTAPLEWLYMRGSGSDFLDAVFVLPVNRTDGIARDQRRL